jgi:hypothetical protein
MKKRILTIGLTLVLALALTVTAFAATKAVTKTITFTSYDSKFVNAPVTIKVTNVTAQATKDYSFYLTDDKRTIAGKKSIVLNCTAPTTIMLQPNQGDKNAGVYSFSMSWDGNKVPSKSVKTNFKYYAFNADTNKFDFTKKLNTKIDGCGYADGSTQTLTKAGTYVLYVKSVNDVDETTTQLTPVFIIVK